MTISEFISEIYNSATDKSLFDANIEKIECSNKNDEGYIIIYNKNGKEGQIEVK